MEGAGGGPTFGQSAAAFAGLTATDLAARRRRVALALTVRDLVRPAAVRSRRRIQRRGQDEQQGSLRMAKSYEEMLGALRTSVTEIVAAGREDRDEALAKSFDDFGADLATSLGEDLVLAPGETDAVALLADRLALLEEAIDACEAGEVQPIAGRSPTSGALELAKCAVDLGEIALRTMASEFAVPVRTGETAGEGEVLLKIASPEVNTEILVKTCLPEHLQRLITAPPDTDAALAALAVDLISLAGHDPRTVLAKRAPPQFRRQAEGDDYQEEREDGPPRGRGARAQEDGPRRARPGRGQEQGEQEEEGQPQRGRARPGQEEEQEQDPEAGDPEEFEDEGEGDDLDAATPFEVIGRLGTMGLVEIDEVKGALGAQAETPDGEPLNAVDALAQHLAMVVITANAIQKALDGDPMEEPEAEQQDEMLPPDQAGEQEIEKGTRAGTLRKLAPDTTRLGKQAAAAEERLGHLTSKERLAKRIDETEARLAERLAATERKLAKLQGEPEPAKAALGGARALSKQADNAGLDGETKEESLDDMVERLAKLGPAERQQVMIKMAHQHPFLLGGSGIPIG
jgi:hypothetical protein